MKKLIYPLLNVYRDKVISVIDSIGGQVILVGHSLGGAIISEVAATPGFSTIYQLNTSHSPFLVKPDSVALLLTNIAK